MDLKAQMLLARIIKPFPGTIKPKTSQKAKIDNKIMLQDMRPNNQEVKLARLNNAAIFKEKRVMQDSTESTSQ